MRRNGVYSATTPREGQWGLWNPLIMLIGLAASVSVSTVLFATVLKISFLCLLAVGTFLFPETSVADRTWRIRSCRCGAPNRIHRLYGRLLMGDGFDGLRHAATDLVWS